MKLILIRGLPGAGKSTLAKELVAECEEEIVHLEGDQYFQVGDQYFYDASWVKQAHQRCFRLTEAALNRGLHVIVANTFTRVWEMSGYFAMADHNLMIDVEVLHCTSNYGSVHDVPQDVMKRMQKRWEPYEHERFYDSGHALRA